jgi:hypothetical protein
MGELIIALCGKARSGKDTFAGLLAEELFEFSGRKFVIMAYAHELKLRVQKDFDLSYEQLWGDLKEVPDYRYPKYKINSKDEEPFWTPREILQAYGQFYRTIDANFWVNNLFNVLDDKKYNSVIITDVRHPNEADPVIERGGVLIKIDSGREGKEEIHGQNHISETAMENYDKIDFTVINNWGLRELKEAAKDMVEFLRNLNKI